MNTEIETESKGKYHHLGILLRGFCMGAADVVPGVSGGTIALLTGIYHDLLNAISAFNLSFFRNLLFLRWREAFSCLPWKFILSLGMGIGIAIFSLSRALKIALAQHPILVWSFFFGLVLATVWAVQRRIRRHNQYTVGVMLVAAVGAYFLLGLSPAKTPEEPWFLFLSGMIAVCAMILPGISGAFILVLLGKYEYILHAVVHLNIFPLLLIAMGGALGLLSFSRLLRWLLNRYHDLTITALAGIMLGSLRKLWPWKHTLEGADPSVSPPINILPTEFSPEVAGGMALFALGCALVLWIEHQRARKGSTGKN